MARETKTPKPVAEERLEIRYVPVDTVRQWERNAKKHDFGALWESIQKYGFKDPPKFEPRLNAGKGGIVEGNGRSHVLNEMQLGNEESPRGIIVKDGKWLMPVVFGVDAESERAAEAYGIVHNNMVLAGGDFGPLDSIRMWEEVPYLEVLADLNTNDELPVGIDEDDVDALIARLDDDSPIDFNDRASKPKKEKPTFGVLVICEGEGEQAEQFKRLKEEGYNVVLQGAKPPGVKR